jgi:hypothetical protein
MDLARSVSKARRRGALANVVGAVTALVVFSAQPSELAAKVSFESPYTLAQTYNGALRLLRVDLGLAITERDPAVAYILFEYKSQETSQKVVPGSIEMLEAGRTVKVIVQLGSMPRYHEQALLEALGRKLHSDYGEPSRRQPEPPDGGAEP